MNDELPAFIAAYRAENRGTALDAGAVRERVLEATWRRRRRRLRRAAWLLPIAALLVGSVALAASGPAREITSRVLAAFTRVSPARRAPIRRSGPLASSRAAVRPEPARHPALEATVEPAAPPSVPDVVPRSSPLVSRSASGARHAAPSSPVAAEAKEASVAVVAPTPRGDSALDGALAADVASYRAAHELHFARADYGRALAAWNGYLARFPRGTFAPEARLNRAVCLARLGRAGQALSVLNALSENEDGYTRERAVQLRAALGGGAGRP